MTTYEIVITALFIPLALFAILSIVITLRSSHLMKRLKIFMLFDNSEPIKAESLTFNEYQIRSRVTAEYPHLNSNLGIIYPALGMVGEAGEAADKVKKWWRNGEFSATRKLSSEKRNELIKEVGDELWYLGAIATEGEFTLEEAALTNVAKLTDRKERGVIKSEGDNR